MKGVLKGVSLVRPIFLLCFCLWCCCPYSQFWTRSAAISESELLGNTAGENFITAVGQGEGGLRGLRQEGRTMLISSSADGESMKVRLNPHHSSSALFVSSSFIAKLYDFCVVLYRWRGQPTRICGGTEG